MYLYINIYSYKKHFVEAKHVIGTISGASAVIMTGGDRALVLIKPVLHWRKDKQGIMLNQFRLSGERTVDN